MLVLDPELARIVIDEPDRPQPKLRVADEFTHDESAAVAATDDEHVPRALGDAERADATLGEQVNEEPGAPEQRELEQQEQRDHARRAA